MISWTSHTLLLLLAVQPDAAVAFLPFGSGSIHYHGASSSSLQSRASADDFAAFEASLEEDDQAPTISKSTTKTSSSASAKVKSWTQDLDELLDITTPLSKRQTLLTNLLSANQDIRSSVESAIKGRTVRQREGNDWKAAYYWLPRISSHVSLPWLLFFSAD